jgi:NADH:ubiquinone oxidoreductase subunit 2 (subunit N)
MLPELYQIGIVLVLFIFSLGADRWKSSVPRWIPWLAGIGIPISLLALSSQGEMFMGSYRVDSLSQFFKFAVAVGFTAAVINATPAHPRSAEAS